MIVVRKAHKLDAQAIWDVRNAAINSQCAGHYPPAELKLWTTGEMTERFIETVEDSFYVATSDGHVVGTGTINLESGKVDAIFVHPSHMRAGVGAYVLLHLERLMRASLN
jgi:GNAT superfamily N-acetyltransferase